MRFSQNHTIPEALKISRFWETHNKNPKDWLRCWAASFGPELQRATWKGLSPGFIQGTGLVCSWGFGVGLFFGQAEKKPLATTSVNASELWI